MENKRIQRKELIAKFKTKKVQDYTYAILFLLVSSFFAFFVIRPVLSIAIGLRKEGQDLQRINEVYEQNISKVLELQADLELVRPKKYLLEEALPYGPKLDALVTDFRNIAEEENISLDRVDIEALTIKSASQTKIQQGDQIYGIKIVVGMNGSYEDAHRFLNALSLQKRIKTIESIELSRDLKKTTLLPIATGSANVSTKIKLIMNVQAYYL